MPSAAAVSETTGRAAYAPEAKKYAGQCGTPRFSGMRGYTEFGKPKSECVTEHDRDQCDEARLCERPQQRGLGGRCDAPRAQRGRAEEEKHAKQGARRGEPHGSSR